MYRMPKIVPLIGPDVAGPLGVPHLPRMWLKSVLSAAGILYDEYVDYNRGLNQRVVEGLGLEPDAWFAFLKTMPTYPQAEDYVKAHGTKVDAASLAAVKDTILNHVRPEEAASGIRARAGLDAPELRRACSLINYDDWCTAHQELVAHRAEGIEPIVPMVSSAQMGVLGVPHLPRLWFKALLNAVHALPAEWKTGQNCGFDKNLSGTISMDLDAAVTYINSELPSYVQFESWVRAHIPPADDATKAQWTAKVLGMKKPDEMAVADIAEANIPDKSIRGTILLNDMVDWHHMHAHAVAQRAAVSRV